MDTELLSIGDATYDTFLAPTEAESFCDINNQDSLICFKYGEKIPVSKMDGSVGGNAANNAVGAVRLGIQTAIITNLGTDLTGENILHKLSQEKVQLSHVQKEPHLASNVSIVITYSGERTIFTYHSPFLYKSSFNDIPPIPWIYLTSMGDGYEDFYQSVLDYKLKVSAKMAFNPGSRQLRGNRELLLATISKSNILYVNQEEARRIVGLVDENAPHMGIKELLLNLHQIGALAVFITDGEKGSYSFDGKEYLQCGVLPVGAYERTGAGDAFGSGSLAAIIKGKTISEALLWGTVNSGSVIGYTGAQKGLLREGEIYDWIDRAESSGVSVNII